MKPSKQVRRNLTKTAKSSQRQTETTGRLRHINAASLPGFLHSGKLVWARPGTKAQITVFEITTDRLRPVFQRGDYLQLDTTPPSSDGCVVVAKIRGVRPHILASSCFHCAQ